MASNPPKHNPPVREYKAIAEQFAKAKSKSVQEQQRDLPPLPQSMARSTEELAVERARAAAVRNQRARLAALRSASYSRRWWWTVAFWIWLAGVHLTGIFLFTSGFLLTRLMLDDKSACAAPPVGVVGSEVGNADTGCWHPRAFQRAVVVLIDALRYDFVVPHDGASDAHACHDAMPFLYEMAVQRPRNAFLRPFIADPPTTTLQRLKGLTTGTLPTFADMGSSFAGTAIEEDNLLGQLRNAGRKMAHVGDDTWWALFPGYFEANISVAYDSFNVWDLHTVDNGVIEHMIPLLQPDHGGDWDFLIGHCLGVDHAGHRYGPDHSAMGAKLRQMDSFVRNITRLIDEDTLLVVMGDHGMDSKGDHGGESDDEIEAALWMYSKRPFFGRTSMESAKPPPNAKVRPVGQIDLVPTLALLLGIPVPFNNLGQPIEEAFAGPDGDDWDQLAAVSHVTAAGINRYQQAYFSARGLPLGSEPGSPAHLWQTADGLVRQGAESRRTYSALVEFQKSTLQICKDLWTKFDLGKMVFGGIIMLVGVVVLVMYASKEEDDDDLAEENELEFEFVERGLELQGAEADHDVAYKTLHRRLVTLAGAGLVPGVSMACAIASVGADVAYCVGTAALVSAASVALFSVSSAKKALGLLPSSPWGWLAVVFTAGQCIGFGSNSYTVWEETILTFFIASFGAATLITSFRIASPQERTLAIYHSIMFVALSRVASFSRLCREEQMPYCVSTYYASSSSSTSAPWQLLIPIVVALALPSIVRSFLATSRSYQGIAPGWVGWFVRGMLFLSAAYWVFDAADNDGRWLGSLPAGTLKALGVWTARLVLALALVAGTTGFVYSGPLVDISVAQNQITIVGFANANGARYLMFPLNILVACILVTKPIGSGALALMLWQILTLAELLDLTRLKTHPVGGVVLALLGNFYYFRTGHQAVLSTIQWDSAFVPLYAIRYPWSPLLIVLNTYASQIVAVACAPLLVLWKENPRRKGVLEHVARRAVAPLVAYFAAEALATMVCAGWLRRHLMLYRVFGPRFMMATTLLVVVEVAAVVLALGGVRANTFGVSELFGWAD